MRRNYEVCLESSDTERSTELWLGDHYEDDLCAIGLEVINVAADSIRIRMKLWRDNIPSAEDKMAIMNVPVDTQSYDNIYNCMIAYRDDLIITEENLQ